MARLRRWAWWWLFGLFALGVVAMNNVEARQMEQLITDFTGPEDFRGWMAVNDTVMGGVSRSAIRPSGQGTALFEGHLSLDNGGGFASVRTLPAHHDLAGFAGISLRVRGDGRSYRLRLRADSRFDGVAYQARFETRTGEWIELFLPFADFVPSWRGRVVKEAGALDAARVRSIGLMVADKQEGLFRLELDWLKASSRGPEAADDD
jgi:monofunctional biosynthetic peptidoglycan transglycosylase